MRKRPPSSLAQITLGHLRLHCRDIVECGHPCSDSDCAEKKQLRAVKILLTICKEIVIILVCKISLVVGLIVPE